MIDAFFYNQVFWIGLSALFAGIIFAYACVVAFGFAGEVMGFDAKDIFAFSPQARLNWIRRKMLLKNGFVRFPSLSGRELGKFSKECRWAGFYFGPLERKKFFIWFFAVAFAGFLAGLFFSFSALTQVVFFALAALILFVIFIILRAKRMRRACKEEIPDALITLSDSLKAGYALPQAIALVAEGSREPIASIFGALQRAYSLNMPFFAALARVERDIDIEEWRMVGEAFIVREQVGGNLVVLAQGLAKMFRQRQVLEREIKSSTASGRLSGMIIAGMAPISLALFYVFNKDYISILFASRTGLTLFFAALLMETIGFFMIHKITRISHLV